MSTVKTPINYYIQDNFLYDADEITMDSMDDGIVHFVHGNAIQSSDTIEGHGIHTIEDLEIDLQAATMFLIENGKIKHKIEYTKDQLHVFDRLVELLISRG